jgi:amino acid adenylation domain-containing protein
MSDISIAVQNQENNRPDGHDSVEFEQLENLVTEVCSEILGVRKISLRDNLLEAGMDSIRAMQIVSRLNQELGLQVGIRELIESGTIENVARAVRSQRQFESLVIGSLRRPPLVPLSYAQERVWFLSQLGYSQGYHVVRAFEISGKVDALLVEEAMYHLITRHEVFRTSFRDVQGKPFQHIEEPRRLRMRHYDVSGRSEIMRARDLEAALHELCCAEFVLTEAPLMRVGLIRMGDDSHILALCLHHIISDGWSMGLLTEELAATYTAYSQGMSPVLKSLPVQYADYALWQYEMLTQQRLERELAYWREQLAGYQELGLPADHPRPAQMSGRGGQVRLHVAADDVGELVQFCQKRQITTFVLFMGSVYLLLKRYSSQPDICIGVPVANRDPWQVQDVIGLFVNTLVVRILALNMSCKQLLRNVQARILEAQDHQAVPFEKVVESIQPKRDLARNPIFQVLVNHVTAGREEMRFGESRIKAVDFDQDTAKLDLSFTLLEDPDGSQWVTVEYSRDLYERETVERMSQHLMRAMAGLVEEEEKEIDEIELMSAEEREQVVEEWNRTELEYGKRCVHEWVEEQARGSGGKVAVRWRGGELRYVELEERSRRLGLYLQRAGVGPERLVGMCMGRSGGMVVGMLGILRAGGGYVPLDPGYPQERLRYMVKQSGVSVVVTERGMREKVEEMVEGREGVRVIEVDEEWEEIEKMEGELKREVGEGNVAYVLYTSGSTGQPKGVMLEHRNAVAFLAWVVREFGEEELRGVVAATSLSFDLSVFEIFGPLVSGGEVVVVRDALELGEGIWREGWMEGGGGKLINTVPSAIVELMRMEAVPKEVRWVNLAGEALGWKVVEQVYGRGVEKVRNLYGPTEATTYATWWNVERGKEGVLRIGRPVGNTRIYIVDEGMRAVPVGVVGEIYIGGAGVARGYAGRADLTGERFVPDPFGKAGGERLYRTGDLGRYGRDGAIEYIGRADQQVKVRGFRIECGEIEAVMLEQAGVEGAAVIAKQVNHTVQLVAYYVAGSKAPEVMELKKGLSDKLPDYMIPGLFVSVSALPLTANGKIDRRELMAREVTIVATEEYVAPRADVEAKIAQCWSEVLGVQRIGIRDNFFTLGGHSLLVVQVVNKMNLVAVQCSLRDLYEHPTIESLADYLRLSRTQQSVQTPLPDESFPLLPVQLQAIEVGLQPGRSFIKLTPTLIDVAEDVNESAFVQALDAWYRQTIFSVRFKQENERWCQSYEVRSAYDYCPIQEFNLDHAVADKDLVDEVVKIAYQLKSVIDIYSGPTLLVGLFRKQGRIRYMLWLIDHLLVDNICFFMLFTNFKLAYKQISERNTIWFPVDTIIGRWAAHLTELAHQERLLQEMGSWKSHFPAFVSQRESKTEDSTTQVQAELEHRVRLLDKTTSQRVLGFLIQQGLSFEESCLGIFLWAFRNCFREDPALMCMVANGRDRQVDGIDLSQGMGWFSISYPAKFHLSASGELLEFLHEIARQNSRYSEIKEHYGALRYLNQKTGKELAAVEDWTQSVVFNCMGEVTTPGGKDDVVRLTATCLNVHIEFDRREREKQQFAPSNAGTRVHSPLRRIYFSLSDGAIQIIFYFCKEKVDSQVADNLLEAIGRSFVGLVS